MTQVAQVVPLRDDPQTQALFPGFEPSAVGPAFFNAARRTWMVTRYDEVQQVLIDYRTFSSRRGGLTPAVTLARNPGSNMITMDPPQHQRHRLFFNEAFLAQVIDPLAPQLEAHAHRLLDRVVEQGHMDVITDFAHQLALTIISELLGIPIDDRDAFQRLSDIEITSPKSAQVQRELERMLAPILEQRRHEPQPDLISELLVTERDGERLSDAEIIASCGLLLMAGHRSPRNMIGNAMLCLGAFPQTIADIQRDNALLPGFIDEALRFVPAFLSGPRIATTDTHIGDVQIKAGDWLLPQYASANRDPAVFTDPLTFDIRRNPNPHISFGHGVHLCIAQPLARLDVTVGVKALLARLTDITIDYEADMQPSQSPVVYGVKHLPITFTAR